MKYFVTSDIHSFFDEMMEALNKAGFEKDNSQHKLIICGDLFDRGPKSKEILQYVQNLGDRFIYIRGNHEDLLSDCVYEIAKGYIPSNHHWSNGTVKTICDLCGIGESDLFRSTVETQNKVYGIMKNILDWIEDKSQDCAEIGSYIFVHGWLPCDNFDLTGIPAQSDLKLIPKEEWNKMYWEDARWINGMRAWKQGCRIPDKTIVCGHWHTSMAHSVVHGVGTEWGSDACFDIFQDEGIIMLDACTARSKKCNVLEIEV